LLLTKCQEANTVVEVVRAHAEVAMAEISNEVVLAETKLLADIIHCSVCGGVLNDAKLLPCGHSYCLGCLEGLAGSAVQLECPECHSNCSVPSGGLQSLPPNVYIDALVQLRDLPTSVGSGDECSSAAVGGQLGHAASTKDAAKPSSPPLSVPYSAATSAEGQCSRIRILRFF